MNIYQTVLEQLTKQGIIIKLYHFQGRLTNYQIQLNHKNELQIPKGPYVYLSRTLLHHEYYTKKSILKDLNELTQQRFGEVIYKLDLNNKHIYHETRMLIEENQEKLLYRSYEINALYAYKALIEKYAIPNHIKTRQECQKQMPEFCDTRKHHGGYGIKGSWSKLLEDSTLCTNCYEIDYKDVLSIVEMIHKRQMGSLKDCGRYGVEQFLEYPRHISDFSNNLSNNSFHKFTLLADLQKINKHIALEDNIQNYINAYEQAKININDLLEKEYKKILK